MSQRRVFGSGSGAGSHPVGSGTHCIYIRFVFHQHGHDLLHVADINYQRKKRGLPNAKYVYVTAYNPDAEIRWHHHIVMDGALDMETVESCWKQSSLDNAYEISVDESNLVKENTKAAEAIKSWFSKVQEKNDAAA